MDIDNKTALLIASARRASRSLALLDDEKLSKVLQDVARAIEDNTEKLIQANVLDLERMDRQSPLYDRLLLNPVRLKSIASDMRQVSLLPSPLGRTLVERTLPNGLYLRRISVPFGVVGVIYEARPNVTFDVFALCLKSGNVCVLKGGSDASFSNSKAVEIIQNVLVQHGIDTATVTLLPPTRQATAALLSAKPGVDVCIPRGGRGLIDFVRENAHIPVIETGAGVVNTFFDLFGDIVKGTRIIENAKTRRVSVCNALDCLIIHRKRLEDLPVLCAPLVQKEVEIYADEQAFASLNGKYPEKFLLHADDKTYGTEFMDYKLAIKTVENLKDAINHISLYGSGHSECIITENKDNARYFQASVDASCVYVNAPTSFTDGAQFGLGAEIGISTQKLGPRGPMGLEELTTYKWLIEGEGQIRE